MSEKNRREATHSSSFTEYRRRTMMQCYCSAPKATESSMEMEENRTYMDLSFSRAPKKNHEAMAQKPIVKTAATASDEASIIDVLLRAFAVDPAARWAWSDPKQYFIHFPSFVKAFGGNAFAYRSAYYVEGYAGAALWLPPNIQPNEDALTSILRNTVPEQIQNDAFEVFERMGRYHPSEPHWYLPLMGVDPLQQGKGFGSALLQHTLSQCDRDSKLAYLESSNAKNIPLYRRHGFELLGTIQIGTSPSIFPMLRRPR